LLENYQTLYKYKKIRVFDGLENILTYAFLPIKLLFLKLFK